MNNTPVLSVIMSVYNGESYLEEAVESVLNQTFTDFELIIINDCSTDSTAEILEKLEDLGYKMGEIRKTVNEMRDSNSEIPEDKWKCSKCGRLNENYTGSCACGASRY